MNVDYENQDINGANEIEIEPNTENQETEKYNNMLKALEEAINNQSDEHFLMADVCRLLDLTSRKVRYLEEQTGIQIRRDNNNIRIYEKEDIILFFNVLRLRENGLNYEAIRGQLIRNGQASPVHESTSLVFPEDTKTFEDFVNTIHRMVESVVKENNTELKNSFEETRKENEELKRMIEELTQTNQSIIEESRKQSSELMDKIESMNKQVDKKIEEINQKPTKRSIFSFGKK